MLRKLQMQEASQMQTHALVCCFIQEQVADLRCLSGITLGLLDLKYSPASLPADARTDPAVQCAQSLQDSHVQAVAAGGAYRAPALQALPASSLHPQQQAPWGHNVFLRHHETFKLNLLVE